jgi:hypothetical protein
VTSSLKGSSHSHDSKAPSTEPMGDEPNGILAITEYQAQQWLLQRIARVAREVRFSGRYRDGSNHSARHAEMTSAERPLAEESTIREPSTKASTPSACSAGDVGPGERREEDRSSSRLALKLIDHALRGSVTLWSCWQGDADCGVDSRSPILMQTPAWRGRAPIPRTAIPWPPKGYRDGVARALRRSGPSPPCRPRCDTRRHQPNRVLPP